MREERTLIDYARLPLPVLRWSAILGGTFFAFGIMMILGFFGVAVGSLITAAKTWSGIWSLVTIFVGFLAGGWLAARASGAFTPFLGRLHALVMWGVASAAILYFAVASTTQLATMLSFVTGTNLQVNAEPGTIASITSTAGIWSLIVLVAGLVGALVGGSVGTLTRVEEAAGPDIRRVA